MSQSAFMENFSWGHNASEYSDNEPYSKQNHYISSSSTPPSSLGTIQGKKPMFFTKTSKQKKNSIFLAHCFILAEHSAACIYIAIGIDLLHMYFWMPQLLK